MPTTPYGRLISRLVEIHETGSDNTCEACGDQMPCDTMRAVWIYNLETRLPVVC